MLQSTSFVAVIRSPVQCSKTFDPNYDAFFDDACRKNTCEDFVSCGLMQGAVEAICRRYVSVERPARWYVEGLELVEKVSDRARSSDSAVEKNKR